jgi:hypothetical protein
MFGYCILWGLLDAKHRMLAEVGSLAAIGRQAISRTQCANLTCRMPVHILYDVMNSGSLKSQTQFVQLEKDESVQNANACRDAGALTKAKRGS